MIMAGDIYESFGNKTLNDKIDVTEMVDDKTRNMTHILLGSSVYRH